MIRWGATIALLLASAAAVWFHPPIDLAAGRGLLREVPGEFGSWQGEELRFEDAVVEDLRADDLLIRRYRSHGRSAWLCVVYHQNRRYGAHDPHLCYESQGFVVREEGHRSLDNGTPEGLLVNAFAAERRGRTRLVWYWWTTDGLTTADARRFRAQMAVLGALENRSWGAFVRVEVIVGDDGRAAAEARLADFAGQVARAMPGVFARASTPRPGP